MHDVDDQFLVERLLLATRRTVDEREARLVEGLAVHLGPLRVEVHAPLDDATVIDDDFTHARRRDRGRETLRDPHVLEVPEDADVHVGRDAVARQRSAARLLVLRVK